MIEIDIPGRGILQLEHLVCDVNGTLAVDGKLIEGVAATINRLRDRLTVHLVTANTHGSQNLIDQQLSLQAHILTSGDEARQKTEYIQHLGAEHVIAIGQGANDAGMLAAAAIGICVFSREGSALAAVHSADLVTADILTAFELIEKPVRLIATLRT